jgi:hypothetical protein
MTLALGAETLIKNAEFVIGTFSAAMSRAQFGGLLV